jgi:hypothetical protein
MSSAAQVDARAPGGVHARRRIAVGVLSVAAASVAAPMVGRAEALPSCGGNQKVETAPFTCEKSRTIDGTTFSVVLDVRNGVVTVTYALSAPRQVDTPIRIRSHEGISSQPIVSETEAVIPAGGTTAILSTALMCGQIDVKAVFIGNGDARGRVVAPYVTDTNNCVAQVTTTTAATTTTASTTTPTTSPTSGATTTSVAATVVTSPPGSLPVTGSGAGLAAVGGGLLVAGLVLATASRNRRRADEVL